MIFGFGFIQSGGGSVTFPLTPSQGGTGTSTVFTQGSVIFAGASGVYTEDNANLFWDNSNNYLGIGTNAPTGFLDVWVSGSSRFRMASNGRTFWRNYTAVDTNGSIWFNPSQAGISPAIYYYDSIFSGSTGTFIGSIGWATSAGDILTNTATNDFVIRNDGAAIWMGNNGASGRFRFNPSGNGQLYIGYDSSSRSNVGTFIVQQDTGLTEQSMVNRANDGSNYIYFYNKSDVSTLSNLGALESYAYNAGGNALYLRLTAYTPSNGLILHTAASDPIIIQTNNTERWKFLGDGKIAAVLQVGNSGLSSTQLYKDTAENILANSDYVVGMKA